MLPRLRFVIAALALAILPWLVLGTGAAKRGDVSAPVFDFSSSRGELLRQAAVSADSQQLQVFAYARRAEELNRLRALASASLPDWIAAPAGDIAVETSVDNPASAADPPADQPVPLNNPEPQPTPAAEPPELIASLSEPAAAPAPEAEPPADVAPAGPASDDQSPKAEADVQAEASPVPIPQARPPQRKLSAAGKRTVVRIGNTRAAGPSPTTDASSNPFSSLFNSP